MTTRDPDERIQELLQSNEYWRQRALAQDRFRALWDLMEPTRRIVKNVHPEVHQPLCEAAMRLTGPYRPPVTLFGELLTRTIIAANVNGYSYDELVEAAYRAPVGPPPPKAFDPASISQAVDTLVADFRRVSTFSTPDDRELLKKILVEFAQHLHTQWVQS